jgi:hypothetical protein
VLALDNVFFKTDDLGLHVVLKFEFMAPHRFVKLAFVLHVRLQSCRHSQVVHIF